MAGEFDIVLDEEEARLAEQNRNAVTSSYDSVLDEEVRERNSLLGASLRQAVGANPDKVAKQAQLSRDTGLPLPIVERNEDFVAAQARVKQLQDLARYSPVLARQLSDPNFAKLAHDDAEQLSLFEIATRALKRGFKSTQQGAAAEAVRESFEIGALIDRIEAGELKTDAEIMNASPYGSMFMGTGRSPEALAARRKRLQERIADNIVEYVKRAPELAALEPTRALRRLNQAETFGEGFRALADDPATIASEVLPQSLGALAPALPAIIGGGMAGGVRGLAIATGFSSAATEYLNALPELFAEFRVDVKDPAAVRAAVLSPAFQERLRDKIARAAVIGTIDAATAGLVGRAIAPTRLLNIGAQTGVQAAGGAAGEALGSAVAGEDISPGAVLAEAIAEGPTALVDIAVLAARERVRQREKAEAATRSAEALSALGKTAASSKLRARDPEAFKRFAEAAGIDAEAPELFIDAQAFTNALRQAGVEPAEVLAQLPSVREQLAEAAATQGDLRIPMGEFAAQLAGTDAGNALLPHLRVDADAMSQAEAQAYFQDERQAADMRSEVERLAAEMAGLDAEVQAAARTVRGQVLEQLRSVGRFTEDVNQAYADLVSSFYTAMAARVGTTAEQLAQQHKLNIVSQLSFDAARALEQPAFHGSPHDFDRFSLDKIGTGEGAQAFGWGLYFAENPAVAGQYYEKLAGRPEIKELKLGTLRIGAFNNFDYSRRASQNNVENVRASLAEELLIEEAALVAAGTGGIQQHVLKVLDDRIANYYDPEQDAEMLEAAKTLRKELARKGAVSLRLGKQSGGVYQVDIPDEAVARMLDWDKSLSEQTDAVKQAVRDMLKSAGYLRENDNGPRVLLSAWKAYVNEHGGVGEGDSGGTIYQAFVNRAVSERSAGSGEADAQKAASLWLRDNYGIPGIKYLDAGSRDTKKGTRNLVVFDDKIITITHKNGKPLTPQKRQLLEQATRGAFDPASNTIALLKNADLSTFIHEAGHFFLEVSAELAARPDAPAQMRADMQTLLDWFGVKDFETWRAMSLDEKREHHEKFARGFEAYVFEGEAPSLELAGVFRRFRAWLLRVYRSLKALRVELNDEVRAVFDRMLATEEQIAVAQAARSYRPLFGDPEAAGMTGEQWTDYQRLGLEATAEASAQLERRSLRDMQWLANAKSRKLRELQAAVADKRAEVRKEAEAEIYSLPIYQAMRFLTHGQLPERSRTNAERKLLESIAGVPTKLKLDDLKAMYGDAPAAPWRYLPSGKFGMVSAQGGLHPDLVAELFGFTSGDELVRRLLAADKPADAIEALTDQRMLERYGDLTSPEALERATEEALHNEARARFVAAELKALSKATGAPRVMAAAAKQFAEAAIARKRIQAIRPAQYSTAETRAAKAAERTLQAGDMQAAAVHKRAQLVNHQLVRAANAALEEVDKGVRYLKKFDRDGTRANLDIEYLDQIDQLLERFDLRQASRREVERRTALRDWIEEQRAKGFEPTIDKALLAEAQRQHYSTLTLEEFRGLVDAVKNIEHLGRLKKKLLTAKDKREFDERVAEAVASVHDNATRTVPEQRSSDRGALVGVGRMFRGFLAEHRKFSSLIREMDGFKDGGVMWELFSRTMNEAGDREAAMREQATMKLSKLLKPILKGGLGQKTYVERVNRSFTREERIGIALNMGNEINRERVLTGERWSPSQLEAVLDTLTKEEWDFVQGVWDYLESFRPQIAEKQKRVTGVEPEWVEPRQVVTKHGVYRGGYYPIKYDALLDSRSEADDAAAVQRQMERGLYVRAQTRRGHLEARTESTGRRLRYDLGVVTQHVDQVIHDLAWHEWLIDANRLLGAKALDSAIREHYGPEVLQQMKTMLRDIAVGELAAQEWFERGVNYLRHGATIVGLGWSLITTMLQPLGITQSIVRIGPKWVAKGLARWIGGAVRMEGTVKWIYERSDFMRLRGKTMQREINEIRNKVAGRNSALEASYFWMIQKMQMVADVPTWLGAYEKALAQDGMTEERAIALADQAVIDSQGAGQIKDLAQIQRGSASKRLYTNFYSFFNTTYNLAVEQSKGRLRKASPAQIAALAGDYLLLFIVPSVLAELLKGAMRGDEPEEIAENLVREAINYLFGTMVGLRELGAAIQGFQGYQGPAGTRFFSEVAKLVKQVEQGEVDEALLKAVANTAGVLFHLPTGQVTLTADGIHALTTGATDNPGALIVGSREN